MLADLNKLDTTVVGVSMDTLESHRAFAKSHGLTFPLLSDPKGELAAAYGVPTRPRFIERVTFVIDADKKIARVFSRIRATEHVTRAVAAIRELPR